MIKTTSPSAILIILYLDDCVMHLPRPFLCSHGSYGQMDRSNLNRRFKLIPPILRIALHLEAGPNPLETDYMKFQPFLGWRPASTTHYNKIITRVDFLIYKGLRAKKLGRFNGRTLDSVEDDDGRVRVQPR